MRIVAGVDVGLSGAVALVTETLARTFATSAGMVPGKLV
jgi:hypothetical protein